MKQTIEVLKDLLWNHKSAEGCEKVSVALSKAIQVCEAVMMAESELSDNTIGKVVEEIAYKQTAKEQCDDFMNKVWILKDLLSPTLAKHILEKEELKQTIEQLQAELKAIKERASEEEIQKIIEESEDCPNCDNSGAYLQGVGDNYEAVLERCEWCWTNPKSKFNLPKAISKHIQGGEG